MTNKTPALLRSSKKPRKTSHATQPPRKVLESEQAAPQVGLLSVRRPLDEVARSGYTFEQMAALLLAAARNQNLGEYWALADRIEEVDAQWRSLTGTRKLAVLGCKWQITPKDNSRLQKKKAEYFQGLVARDWFPDTSMHLLDAIAKGSAVAENVYVIGDDGLVDIERVVERPMRFFNFDPADGKTLLLKTTPAHTGSASVPGDLSTVGEPLEPHKYLVHQPVTKSGTPVRRGLAFCAVGVWLAKALMKSNWWSYTERAGQPFRYATYAEGTPEKRVRRMSRVLAALGTDAYAVFPRDFELQISNAMATGNIQAFKEALDYSDESLAKLALGQTQTSDAKGSSYASAKVGNEVRQDIVTSDARQLAATYKRDLFASLCYFRYGDRELPNIELVVDEPADLAAEADILEKITGAGVQVSQAEVRSRFGYREPEEGEALTSAAGASAPADPKEPPAAAAQSRARQGGCPVHDTHAEGEPPPRDSIDDLVDSMADEWEKVGTDLLEEFLRAAANAKDPEALGRALQAAAKDANPKGILELLKEGRVIAEVVGAAGGDIGDGNP